MQDDLIKKAVERLKNENIQPEPKWKVNLDNYFIWAAFVLLVLLCAVAIAVTIYLLRDLDWDVFGRVHQERKLLFLLRAIPVIWVVLFLFLIFASLFDLRMTKRGYRYRLINIVGLTLIFVGGAGFIVHLFGLPGKINDKFLQKVPPYKKFVCTRQMQWAHPEDRLLGGKIVQTDENFITIKAFDGENWSVVYDDQTIFIPRNLVFRQDELIKVIGDILSLDERKFKAEEIRLENNMKLRVMMPMLQR